MNNLFKTMNSESMKKTNSLSKFYCKSPSIDDLTLFPELHHSQVKTLPKVRVLSGKDDAFSALEMRKSVKSNDDTTTILVINNNKISFTEIVSTEKEEEEEKEQVEKGWIVLKPKKILYKKDKSTEEEENQYQNDVIDRLNDLHEKRKADYIEKWGLDEYEKLYRFSNYDYDYFDRLDAEEEKKQQEEQQNYYENDDFE